MYWYTSCGKLTHWQVPHSKGDHAGHTIVGARYIPVVGTTSTSWGWAIKGLALDSSAVPARKRYRRPWTRGCHVPAPRLLTLSQSFRRGWHQHGLLCYNQEAGLSLSSTVWHVTMRC